MSLNGGRAKGEVVVSNVDARCHVAYLQSLQWGMTGCNGGCDVV